MPARCVVLGSWSMKYLWLLSCKFLWGLRKGETCLEFGFHLGKSTMLGCEKGLSKLAVLSSKSTCNLCVAFGVKVKHLAVYSCVQFALTTDWEALGQF